MNKIDEKYHNLARTALFTGLITCEFTSDINIKVEKSEILMAFEYSGNILRSNLGEEHYRLIADTVFQTCIRLARCLFFPVEARTIVLNGKEYSITAEQQLNVLRRNLTELQRYES